jgi:hypothetical protein
MGRQVHPHARRRSIVWIVAGAGVVVLVVVLAGVWWSSSVSTAPAAPHFVSLGETDKQATAGQRTVVIAQAGTRPTVSGRDGRLMTTLLEGKMPAGATQAVVRTDTNCAPDAQGVSHCQNQLDIGGTLVTVQHHHKMSTTPCLTPGETVTLAQA